MTTQLLEKMIGTVGENITDYYRLEQLLKQGSTILYAGSSDSTSSRILRNEIKKNEDLRNARERLLKKLEQRKSLRNS
jgi:hypothetical protein